MNSTLMNHLICQMEWDLKHFFGPEFFVKGTLIQYYSILNEEKQLVSQAVEKRKNEFYTGRWLAAQGLKKLGYIDFPVLVGKLKNPIWPNNILGSITHDGAICLVTLIEKNHQAGRGLGIDLIQLDERSTNIADMGSLFLSQPDESKQVSDIAEQLSLPAELIIFSLKESLIKGLKFYLNEFIDLCEIHIMEINQEQVSIKVFGQTMLAKVGFMRYESYFLTAVYMY